MARSIDAVDSELRNWSIPNRLQAMSISDIADNVTSPAAKLASPCAMMLAFWPTIIRGEETTTLPELAVEAADQWLALPPT